MQNKTINIFTYGILIFPEVMFTHCKNKYDSCKATLNGYIRRGVKDQFYPGITLNAESKVEGTLYFNVQEQDVASLDIVEMIKEGTYIKTDVTVLTEKGNQSAMAYVIANPANLLPNEWDIQNFKNTGFKAYQTK